MGLSNSQYETLMRGYSQQQSRSRRELEERRKKAYSAIPELSELDRKSGALGLARARAILGADETPAADAPGSSEEFRARLEEISARRAALLKEHGLAPDYLEMRYACPDCRDTGYVNGERCHCFLQAAADLLYEQSGLRDILEEENFDTFSLDYYPDDLIHPQTGKSARLYMQEVRALCLRFVREFDLPADQRAHTNLFLYGGCGLGKTFLSHCIAKELIETSHYVLYFSAGDLFDRLAQETFRRDGAAQEEDGVTFGDVCECDLLIIDDLGTEMTNTFVASGLFRILTRRLQENKSTVISTNLSLQAFSDTYSERVFSRITSSFKLIQLFGNDIRLQKKLLGRS